MCIHNGRPCRICDNERMELDFLREANQELIDENIYFVDLIHELQNALGVELNCEVRRFEPRLERGEGVPGVPEEDGDEEEQEAIVLHLPVKRAEND